ncbi:MAG: DUF1150 family protein [Alphaproteobacteria bacterium]|nr:DUF1150 family protein [Alphaproteobacteria bacterium]MBV8548256.1 DUF1150 family protein [Alphaproteobacteria bacterium]
MITKNDILQHKTQSDCNDLGSLGLEDMAYIKTVVVDGKKLHSIHAADGTPLTVVGDRQVAFATVGQHDMQALSVH